MKTLPFKLNDLKNNQPLQISLALHLSILMVFVFILYSEQPKGQEELTFTVIEKIVVDKDVKPVVAKITKPKPKKKKQIKKRQVFGVSRKSITSSKGVAVKRGNTVAKTPDNKKLRKEDEDALPIPADEFLISSMPQVLEEIRPKYPPSQKKAGVEGRVVFDILIDAKGKVRQANIVKSLGEDFDQAAYEAMMRFRFRPATMDDKAVAVKIKYAINFILE